VHNELDADVIKITSLIGKGKERSGVGRRTWGREKKLGIKGTEVVPFNDIH
jgi:hypothetical protein